MLFRSDMVNDQERLRLDWMKLGLEAEKSELQYGQAVNVAAIKAETERARIGRQDAN